MLKNNPPIHTKLPSKSLAIFLAVFCLNFIFCLNTSTASANPQSIPIDSLDKPFDLSSHTPKRPINNTNFEISNTTPNTHFNGINIDEKMLMQNVDLFNQLLSQAIDSGHIGAIDAMLPYYKKTKNHDTILANFGQALSLRAKHKQAQAIKIYQNILEQNPALGVVRLQLAQAYLENLQFNNAKNTLFAIIQDQTTPDNIKTLAHHLIQNIKKRQKSVQFNAHFIQDNNANNAPDRQVYGNWTLPTKQTAQGLGYTLSADYDFHLNNTWHLVAKTDIIGKSYWQGSQYSDISVNTALDIATKNSTGQVAFSPFVNRRFFEHDPYSTVFGVKLHGDYHKNHLYSQAVLSYGQKRHDTRPFLDGKSYTVSAFMQDNTKQATHGFGVYVGGQFGRETAKDPSDSYRHATLYAGIYKDWGKSLTSTHTLSVGKRHYDSADIFGVRRQDNEYQSTHRLWANDFRIFGLTPSLNAQFVRIDSTHFAYDRTDKSVFVGLDKRF